METSFKAIVYRRGSVGWGRGSGVGVVKNITYPTAGCKDTGQKCSYFPLIYCGSGGFVLGHVGLGVRSNKGLGNCGQTT